VEAEKEHGGPLRRGRARRLYPGFRHGKGQQEISEKRRVGYAVFNYEAASDKFSADPKSFSDCGYACHTPVKAKDYIFHPYQKR
jgi:Cytochrome P460